MGGAVRGASIEENCSVDGDSQMSSMSEGPSRDSFLYNKKMLKLTKKISGLSELVFRGVAMTYATGGNCSLIFSVQQDSRVLQREV